MKIYPDAKVYIICPGKYHSGGPELCHQLCSQLILFGINSKILYVPGPVHFTRENPVHDNYKKYHLPYTFELEDTPKNILFVPEAFTEYLYLTNKIQRVLWWMSVDNYLVNISINVNAVLNFPLVTFIMKFFSFHKRDSDIEHWVQSEYARQFVKLNGVPDERIHTVEDYLNPTFFSRAMRVDLSKKENVVVYYPQKGFEITQVLIQIAPDIDWLPIENMTPAQVQELLARAKVYIDFGNHPGRDRIPREAAISGCVVITGKRGAAANDVDINIPDEFKFEEQTTEVWDVIKKIRDIFADFNKAYEKQADYRARIFDDKNRFVKEVEEFFEAESLTLKNVAFVQGLNEKSFLLAQELFQSKSLNPDFIIDDVMASTKISDTLILRKQNRNYLRVGQNFIEIITRDDAKFLYQEGRIKKFALLEPDDTELNEVINFYESADEDILIFNLEEQE